MSTLTVVALRTWSAEAEDEGLYAWHPVAICDWYEAHRICVFASQATLEPVVAVSLILVDGKVYGTRELAAARGRALSAGFAEEIRRGRRIGVHV